MTTTSRPARVHRRLAAIEHRDASKLGQVVHGIHHVPRGNVNVRSRKPPRREHLQAPAATTTASKSVDQLGGNLGIGSRRHSARNTMPSSAHERRRDARPRTSRASCSGMPYMSRPPGAVVDARTRVTRAPRRAKLPCCHQARRAGAHHGNRWVRPRPAGSKRRGPPLAHCHGR